MILSIKCLCFHVVLSCSVTFQSLRVVEHKLYSIKYYGYSRMHHDVRARFLPFPDTMMDIFLLPLQMHSSYSPRALCLRLCTVLNVSMTSPALWKNIRVKEEKTARVCILHSLEPYCYWSTLVGCIQCLKCTALGPFISYPFHTVTFSYFQKLLFPWLLWPRAANILPLFLVLGIAASCIGQTSHRLKMSLYWSLLNCCIWMCLLFLPEHWCSSKWFKYL